MCQDDLLEISERLFNHPLNDRPLSNSFVSTLSSGSFSEHPHTRIYPGLSTPISQRTVSDSITEICSNNCWGNEGIERSERFGERQLIALETKKNRNFDNEVDRACINDMPVEKRRPSIAIEDLLNPDSHGDSLGQDDEETRDAADDVGEVKIARAGRVS